MGILHEQEHEKITYSYKNPLLKEPLIHKNPVPAVWCISTELCIFSECVNEPPKKQPLL